MSECDEYTSQISHDILDKISRNTINKLNTRTSKSSSSMNTSITTKKKSNGMKVKSSAECVPALKCSATWEE